MVESAREPRTPDDRRHAPVNAGRLILPIMLFVLAGIPLIAYVWETANRLFAGRFEAVRLLVAAAALIALLFVLKVLARVVQQWEGARSD